MSVRVEIKCLREDAQAPRYMSEFAAGADLVAAIDEKLIIPPGGRIAVGTGLALAISTGYEGQVRPRSGMAIRHGLTVVNAPGTIDSDYRGEVKVLLVNVGQEPVCIEPGQRIAQLIIAPVVQAEFCVVDELSETGRGAQGFGSTGSSS